MNISRFVFLILLSAPLMACASALTVSANRGLLEEEVARLSPVKPIPLRVTIKVDAPELVAGQKPGRMGDPSFSLEYSAREMLEQATQATVVRWFADNKQARDSVRLEVHLRTLVWDEYTDVFMWRAVVQEVNVEIQAIYGSEKSFSKSYSSGKLKGDWKRSTTERNEQYSRLIYRALLIALDKAMADLAQRKLAPTTAPP